MAAGRVPQDKIEEVERLVDKYMTMLKVKAQRPHVRYESKLGAHYLGVCHWTPSLPDTTTISLQKSILDHSQTLERVVAHEMVHHQELTSLTESDKRLLQLGIKPRSHGPSFKTGAALVNAIMGPSFVTETSDTDYVVATNSKPYFLLIKPIARNTPTYGWAWGVRLSAHMKEKIAKEQASGGARLFQVTDSKWTAGAKIERFGGFSLPRRDEEVSELAALYARAPQAKI